ncbi:MAG: preprotein translocase subunit YajC [Gemmatimonas sp.]
MTVPIAASLVAIQAAGSSIAQMVFMYGAIFAIFYFVLIRPQQQQRKKHEALIKELKKGDEVVTAGGIVGEVLHIAQQMKDGATVSSMDDRITIKSADSRLIIERGRISRVVSSAASA